VKQVRITISCKFQVAPGSNLHCTVTYINESNVAIQNVEIVIILPNEMIAGAENTQQALASNALQATQVAVGSLEPGQNGSQNFAIPVPEAITEGNRTITAILRGETSEGELGEVTVETEVMVAPFRTYLPMVPGVPAVPPQVAETEPRGPDLVGSIHLEPAQETFADNEPVIITVKLSNQGDEPVMPGFWTDLYINPVSQPGINTPWDDICNLWPCQGIVWSVNETIAPGASITLTSTPDSYSAEHTDWDGTFVVGTTDLYLYVDGWKPDSPVGAVDEEEGESNNLFHLGGLEVTEATLLQASEF
jgi:hypothetical protein